MRPLLLFRLGLVAIRRPLQWRQAVWEQGMNWAEAMKETADAASQDRVSTDANVMRSAIPASWHPHEVWLTRVKQPRDLAVRRVTSNAVNHERTLPD